MIKRSIWLLCAAAILLTAAAGRAGDDHETPRVIAVEGEAEMEAAPDEVNITVTLEGRDKELERAKKAYDEQMRDLQDIAGRYGIERKYISSQHASIQPQYRYVQNRQRIFEGYAVTNSITLRLRAIDKQAALVEALVSKNIGRVDHVRFALSNQQELEEEVMLKALENAKSKAERMVKTLDAKLGGILTIREHAFRQPPPVLLSRMMTADAAMETAEGKAVDFALAGEQTIRNSVYVEFEIED